jgi:hypothetical protein
MSRDVKEDLAMKKSFPKCVRRSAFPSCGRFKPLRVPVDVVQMPPGLDPDDLPVRQQPGFSRARKVGPGSFANRFGISIALRFDQVIKNQIVRAVADQPTGNSRSSSK